MPREVLSVETLDQLLRLDIETGHLYWRERGAEWFLGSDPAKSAKIWNARYANTKAGYFHKSGYIYLKIQDRSYRASRVVFAMTYGRWPTALVNHRNGDTTDDRPENLREATRPENCASARLRRDNSSGFKGVREFHSGRWQARIGKAYIGTFDTPEEAHAAYIAAARQRYGRFARSA